MSLVKKLRSNEGISSVDIASELASEAIKEVEDASFVVSEDELSAVSKNIRRRLYDSLKVLESVGAIRRTRKDKTLTWVGIKHLIPPRFQTEQLQVKAGSSSNSVVLYQSVAQLRKSIADKQCKLSQLKTQAHAILSLCQRNQHFPGPETLRIQLPFVIIRTPVSTDIKLDATPDASSMVFEFRGHYEIVNDSGILDRMFIVTNPATAALLPPTLPHTSAEHPRRGASTPSDDRSQAVDPFSSPKRRRVASKSLFAKYTSGSKPPLSPGTPLLHENTARKHYISNASSSSQGRSGGRSPGSLGLESPKEISPHRNICTPPRKRRFPFYGENIPNGGDMSDTSKQKKLQRRTYGPLQGRSSFQRKPIQPVRELSSSP